MSVDEDDTAKGVGAVNNDGEVIGRPSTPTPGDGTPAANTPRDIINTPERQKLRDVEARYFLIEEEATILSNRCHAYMLLSGEYGKVRVKAECEAEGEESK